jgi:hypothetical protein
MKINIDLLKWMHANTGHINDLQSMAGSLPTTVAPQFGDLNQRQTLIDMLTYDTKHIVINIL